MNPKLELRHRGNKLLGLDEGLGTYFKTDLGALGSDPIPIGCYPHSGMMLLCVGVRLGMENLMRIWGVFM